MFNIPSHLKYTTNHEWVDLQEDGTILIGISHFAQYQLGDIVFVQMLNEGESIVAQQVIATIESVKTAADIYAPVSGTVLSINIDVAKNPEYLNHDPYQAWLFRIVPDDKGDIDVLMNSLAYQDYLDE